MHKKNENHVVTGASQSMKYDDINSKSWVNSFEFISIICMYMIDLTGNEQDNF